MTNAPKLVRLDHVERLLREGRSRADVVTELARHGASPRSVDRLIAECRQRWANEAAEQRPSALAVTLVRLDRLSPILEAEKAWGPLVQLEKLRADVQGLRSHRVEVDGSVELRAAPAVDEPLTTHEVQLAQVVIETERARLSPPASSTNPTVPEPDTKLGER
jgi:hypothetical protein